MSASLLDMTETAFEELGRELEKMGASIAGDLKAHALELSNLALNLAAERAAGRLSTEQFEEGRTNLVLAARSRLASAGIEAREAAIQATTSVILKILTTALAAI